jgi:hypothetical protein
MLMQNIGVYLTTLLEVNRTDGIVQSAIVLVLYLASVAGVMQEQRMVIAIGSQPAEGAEDVFARWVGWTIWINMRLIR